MGETKSSQMQIRLQSAKAFFFFFLEENTNIRFTVCFETLTDLTNRFMLFMEILRSAVGLCSAWDIKGGAMA